MQRGSPERPEMNHQKLTIYFFLIGLAGFVLGLIVAPNDEATERHIRAQQAYIAYLENYVPTFKELQIMVGAEPDGIVGPNTIEKWEKKICDQYAIESFNRMAGDTNGK